MARKNAKILIEQALIQLLTDKPLNRIDVQDVALAAGLSRQTFYYNFKNKQDLLCWILEEDTAAASEAFRKEGKLQDYICAFLTAAKQKDMFYRAIAASDAHRRSYTAYFENGLLACVQSLESRSSLGRMSSSLWESLHFFTYGASGVMQNWVENGMQQSPELLSELIVRNTPSAVDRYFRSSAER